MSLTDCSKSYHVYKGTRIPPHVTETAVNAVENLEIRDDDVLLTGYPKSGLHGPCTSVTRHVSNSNAKHHHVGVIHDGHQRPIIRSQAVVSLVRTQYTVYSCRGGQTSQAGKTKHIAFVHGLASSVGTHWMIEVIRLILANGDVSKLDYKCRIAFLEGTDVKDLSSLHSKKSNAECANSYPSPRVLKTHLRPHLIPKEALTKKIPIIYLLRNPKDVFLSLFEFQKVFPLSVIKGLDLDKYFEAFMSGNVTFDGWCEHVTSFEALNGKENILYVTYEETKKDPRSTIRSITKHIGKDISDDVVERVVANTTVEAMKRNYENAMQSLEQENPNADVVPLSIFINKGEAGRWKTVNYEDKWKLLDETFKEKVKDTVHAKKYFE